MNQSLDNPKMSQTYLDYINVECRNDFLMLSINKNKFKIYLKYYQFFKYIIFWNYLFATISDILLKSKNIFVTFMDQILYMKVKFRDIWETFKHPPYIPDLAPSNYYIFLHLIQCLASQKFERLHNKSFHFK